MQKPQYHPEGDALYHSLQVFDLAAGRASLRRRISAGGPAARRRQGDRSTRSHWRRARRTRRPYHAAHGLADRASFRGGRPARRHAGGPLAPPARRSRKLRRADAFGPVRSGRTASRRPHERRRRSPRLPPRAGRELRRLTTSARLRLAGIRSPSPARMREQGYGLWIFTPRNRVITELPIGRPILSGTSASPHGAKSCRR